ncbi:MAG: lysoplasmalogenase [Microbacteriaceae bacterium]|nr:lysoplasmalogenase [Microbacteriaceae bacterium]MCL2795414.1 lysoplasmalogenase [Microbacteriaceae bacterium]
MRTTRFWAFLPYAVAAVVNLAAELGGLGGPAAWSQWALMPLLIVAVLATLRPLRTPVTPWLLLGLLFSWAGDVLFGLSFVFGLGAFLCAQVSYIVAFTRRPVAGGNPAWRPWRIAIYAVLFGVLLGLLAAHVGAMLPAVIVYGLALCTMAALASRASRLLEIAGYVFLLSDSLLALRLFRPDLPIPLSGFWVMLTYIAAEAGIAIGVTRAVRRSLSSAQIAWADAATPS